MKTETKWEAVIDGGFSYVQIPPVGDEPLMNIIAQNLTPERATLIAAAPDLLEACKAAVRWLEAVPESDLQPNDRNPATNALIGLRNAIARAEGNQ